MDCISIATQTCGPGISGAMFSQLIGALLVSQCGLNTDYPIDKSNDLVDSYDFIIVGAGSAGSALARHLSDNPDWKILLIEAGSNPPQSSEIPSMFTSLVKSEYDWNYKLEPQKNACHGKEEKLCSFPRGKMLGGSSSINAMVHIIGAKSDYDRWEEMGNKGWGWKSVQKYFKHYMNKGITEQFHLKRLKGDKVHYMMKSLLLNASKEIGIDEIIDPIEQFFSKKGYFTTFSAINSEGTRSNSAKIHLVPVRERSNLHIVKDAHVGKLIISSNHNIVEGVEVWMNNKWTTIKASKEVILSAGVINTPQILMLSGIGPKEHLESLDIDVVKDLPVGKNLHDHTVIPLYFKINSDDIDAATPQQRLDALYNYLIHKTGIISCVNIMNIAGFINTDNVNNDDPNIQLHHIFYRKKDTDIVSSTAKMFDFVPQIKQQLLKANQKSALFNQMPTLLKPISRGELLLQSKDPFEAPTIDPKLHVHPKDLETALAGVRHVLKMSETKAMKKLDVELLKISIPECDSLEYNTDSYWRCMIRYLTSTLFHSVGTAKMGQGDDSVVDERLKVRGFKNLRVADASIMPEIVSANTNAASLMIGEKAADLIKEDMKKT